tara:strand:- start:289 stop:543 length:255 start_codon:yes stop_codon:yes gene_type:complete
MKEKKSWIGLMKLFPSEKKKEVSVLEEEIMVKFADNYAQPTVEVNNNEFIYGLNIDNSVWYKMDCFELAIGLANDINKLKLNNK